MELDVFQGVKSLGKGGVKGILGGLFDVRHHLLARQFLALHAFLGGGGLGGTLLLLVAATLLVDDIGNGVQISRHGGRKG